VLILGISKFCAGSLSTVSTNKYDFPTLSPEQRIPNMVTKRTTVPLRKKQDLPCRSPLPLATPTVSFFSHSTHSPASLTIVARTKQLPRPLPRVAKPEKEKRWFSSAVILFPPPFPLILRVFAQRLFNPQRTSPCIASE